MSEFDKLLNVQLDFEIAKCPDLAVNVDCLNGF